jgi:hypothetical protein
MVEDLGWCPIVGIDKGVSVPKNAWAPRTPVCGINFEPHWHIWGVILLRNPCTAGNPHVPK